MGGAPRRPKFVRSGGESAAGSNGFSFLFAGGSCVRSFRWSRRPPNGFKGRDLNVTHRIRARFPAATAGKTRGLMENAAESLHPPPVGRRPQQPAADPPSVHAMERRKWYPAAASVGDDAPPSRSCPGTRHPRAQGRTRRPRRADRARGARVRHRSPVAEEPARFLASPSAELVVAHLRDRLAGTAIVLFPPRALVARLYSIAVAPHLGGRGVAPALLAAAEAAALARGCRAIRLEVHVTNHAAISRYRKSGYREFGRLRKYYE